MTGDKKLATSKITPELIQYIVQKIVRAINPEKIILFGSYAKGDYRESSDLDLFIIKDGDHNSRMMRRKVADLLWGRKFPVDLWVRKTEEVKRRFEMGIIFICIISLRTERYYMKKNNVEYVKECLLFARDNLIAAKNLLNLILKMNISFHTIQYVLYVKDVQKNT